MPEERKKKYALMLFNTEFELGISQKPGSWVNTKNIRFDDGLTALEAYANIPNPASQLVDGFTEEELVNNMNEMIENYKNEKWLEENLYPYL